MTLAGVGGIVPSYAERAGFDGGGDPIS